MKISKKGWQILDILAKKGKKCLIVSKYLPINDVLALYEAIKEHGAFYGIAENRFERITDLLQIKQSLFMIGGLQSRSLKENVENVAGIVSFCREKELILSKKSEMDRFLQINVSEEVQKHGVLPENVPKMMHFCAENSITMQGFCTHGKMHTTDAEKHEEMQKLLHLRDKYMPTGLICAGTSADWRIAVEYADVLRLGRVLFDFEA